jgi:hypothetical protein
MKKAKEKEGQENEIEFEEMLLREKGLIWANLITI